VTTSRRQFVRTGILGAAGAGLAPGLVSGQASSDPSPRAPARNQVPPAPRSMRILVLGGTSFLGPAQVEYMLDRGHEVTLFNRGRTNPELFPDVEKLRGDRAIGDLESLRGREWDAVIDNSATIPRWALDSTQFLRDSAEYYLHVSSISVYSDTSAVGITEDHPVFELEDPSTEEVTGETYGGMKALCETYTRDAFGDRAIVVRPGLIVGPGDPSDRFTYWPMRIREGGEILAPGDPTDPVQFIDVRDLGEFMVRLVEDGAGGTYHATGPYARPMEIAEMLFGIRASTTTECTWTWVDADFLAEMGVRPWQDMPVWIPPRDGMEGFSRVDCSRALAAGLTFRSLADTVGVTLDWVDAWPEERSSRPPRFGISPSREREVLEAWREAES
jgi:2'-hydroxyisoflavone reductase